MSAFLGVFPYLYIVFVQELVAAVQVPFTPCPAVFNYFVNSNNQEVFGSMKLSNDLTGQYELEVNMSIPMVTDKNIRLGVATPEYKIQNGEMIEYYVYFPYNHTFPLMTSIILNEKLYCIGPPAKDTKDHGVTPLSAKNLLKLRVVDVVLTTTPRARKKPVITDSVNTKISNDAQCGMDINYKSLIFSGAPTTEGQFPWLVAMFLLQDNGTYTFACGGSLVSNRHVITAAHCLRDSSGSRVSKDALTLVLGKRNIRNWVHKSTLRGVKQYFVNPEFISPPDADIAVLLLTELVNYQMNIKPVCIWDEADKLDNIINLNGTVAGWGKDESGDIYVEEPKQIQMPVVSQETCLRSDHRFLTLTSNRTFCAGATKQFRGPCSGDSGSGFIMNRGGTWKLRGIVSVALLDPDSHICDVNNYVVFSDVSKYIPWIQKIMENS